MKHIIALLSIIFLVALWGLPAFMIWNKFPIDWAWLYAPIVGMTFAFYDMINSWYQKD